MAPKPTRNSSTTFFSLPLELRHEIYSYLDFEYWHMTDEPQRTRPWSYDWQSNIRKVKASDPRIDTELLSYYRLHCNQLRFWVNTKPLGLPETIVPYINMRTVHIYIEHYDLEAKDRKAQLDLMRDNLRKFLALLGTRYSTLPEIEVGFQDDGRHGCSPKGHSCRTIEYCGLDEWNYSDEWWAGNWEEDQKKHMYDDTEVDEYDGEALKIVRYGPGDDDWKTVYEYPLDPLYETKIVFGKVEVSQLAGIACCTYLRKGTTDRGEHYMYEKQRQLREWLEGKRNDGRGKELEHVTTDWVDDMLARVVLDAETEVAQ